MPLDIQDPAQLDRVYRAIDWSRYRLQPFRQRRMQILQQLVGYWYSETGAEDRVPVNLISLAANVYLRQLIPSAPRALIRGKSPDLAPLAADLEAWMNEAVVGMELAETLRAYVLDGLVSMGIMKVGVAAGDEIEVGGFTQLLGQPFAERIDLDDWAHDITARRADQCGWMAHRYRVNLDEARECPLFDKKARERLTGMTRFAYNERGDLRSSTLSQSTLQWIDEYKEHCELWEVWLPREKLVVTVPYTESAEGGFSGPPLRIVDWKGPREGPYVFLGFLDVPNNVMPAAPAQAWMDLHLLLNRGWRKLGRQSERQKTVLGVAGPNTEDGERVVKANDGEAIRMDRPDSAREFRFGGADREQMAFVESVRNAFNFVSGNVEGIGGLSPQSHTLGQDKLLSESSNAQVGEMQSRVRAALKKVYCRLGYWWYTDPTRTYVSRREAHGVEVPVSVPPEVRQAVPPEMLDFDIDPYSMEDDSPKARGNRLLQVLQQILLPAMPELARQGVQVKWPVLLNLLAKYLNVPDMADIVAAGPPPELQGAANMAQGAAGGGGEPPRMPAVTSRTHVRQNVPMLTGRGQGQVLQQLLLGGGNAQQRRMVGPAGGLKS